MTFKHLIPWAALVAAFFWAPVSRAESVDCPPRELLMQSLNNSGLSCVWRALSYKGHITEIWTNPNSEDSRWVAVVHLKSNHSCIVDHGVNSKSVGQGRVAI